MFQMLHMAHLFQMLHMVEFFQMLHMVEMSHMHHLVEMSISICVCFGLSCAALLRPKALPWFCAALLWPKALPWFVLCCPPPAQGSTMVCPVLLQAERSERLFRSPPVVLPLGILPRVPLSRQFPCVSVTTATYCRDGGGAVDSLVIRQNAAKCRAWQWINGVGRAVACILALQNAWDRPALGTCPLKCLGQARS